MKLPNNWGYPGLGLCIECSPAPILDHEGEVDVRVQDAMLRDECPVKKGLVVQLLGLPCDELLGTVGRKRRCTRARNFSFLLLGEGFLRGHGGIEMVKT